MKDLFKLKATIDCYYLEGIMEDINLSVRTWEEIFPESENGQYNIFKLTNEAIAHYENDIKYFQQVSKHDKDIEFAESMIKLIYELRKYVSDTEVLVYCWF